MKQTRRDFAKFLLAGVPASIALAARINSTVAGVRLGTITYSFRDFPRTPGQDNVDAIIRALIECEIGEIELFSPNVEPAPAGPAGRGTAQARKNREDLRRWRLETPTEHFRAVRKKFDNAGINVYAYTMNYHGDFTDEEIDKTFEQAKGLGVSILATSTTVDFAPRLVPFAEKHKITVAFHGHSMIHNPNEFSTPETFQKALDLSPLFKVNLDIGHFTAAGYDAVAYIQQHHARITHLHMKDRKKNDGPNMPWGQGDTPIKPVLLLLKTKKYPIPAFIEYEYKGQEGSVAEVKKCMAYMRAALS
ncbi:MAG TPA: TIM barrel protein [Bryobacteraceae bacterium]|jgi:sugar phosphate isomerase/epimerase|nr:TIM barrel protein [Bryobacteraceae bacterium]